MKTKLLGTLMIVFGVFLFVGVASASEIDILQPASTITYNENLDVNGTIYASSAYIGEPGIGGVTFFNGTIVNNSADPVTFGDDVRIDGEIYRIQKGGDPIKLSDNVIPTATNINNFGDSSHRWKSIYGKNINLSSDMIIQGVISGKDMVTIDDDLKVNQDLIVKKDITAKNYKFSSAQTRYLTIDPSTYSAVLDGQQFTVGSRVLTGQGKFFGGVHLPDNARIKKITFWYHDNDSGEIEYQFRRDTNDMTYDPPLELVSFTSTVNASGYSKKEISTDILIDNSKYLYQIQGNISDNTFSLQLGPVKIEYEINSL